jgi:hypothetical protein
MKALGKKEAQEAEKLINEGPITITNEIDNDGLVLFS